MKILFALLNGGSVDGAVGAATHGIVDLSPEVAIRLVDLFLRANAFHAGLAHDGLVSTIGQVKVCSSLAHFTAFEANYDAADTERLLGSLEGKDFVAIGDQEAEALLKEGRPVSVEAFHALVYEQDVVFSAVERHGDARYLTASLPLGLLQQAAA